jgi:glucosamine 6-phosphate synthetase-like amidotransferase/phosphosugar isomerase protein
MGEPAPGLADDAAATGATVICTGDDPLVDLVRVQLLAVQRAARLGLDVDRPRSLNRSVVLTGFP